MDSVDTLKCVLAIRSNFGGEPAIPAVLRIPLLIDIVAKCNLYSVLVANEVLSS
jgi:hypothetical protein